MTDRRRNHALTPLNCGLSVFCRPFSDRFRPFPTVSDRFPTVSDRFPTDSDRIPTTGRNPSEFVEFRRIFHFFRPCRRRKLAGLRSEIPAPDPAKERAREVVQSPNNLSVKRLVLLSNTAKCHCGTPLARQKCEKTIPLLTLGPLRYRFLHEIRRFGDQAR